MSEFPREMLRKMLDEGGLFDVEEQALRDAIRAYDQLSERCVMDRTESSITIGNLRARLAEIDPEFK